MKKSCLAQPWLKASTGPGRGWSIMKFYRKSPRLVNEKGTRHVQLIICLYLIALTALFWKPIKNVADDKHYKTNEGNRKLMKVYYFADLSGYNHSGLCTILPHHGVDHVQTILANLSACKQNNPIWPSLPSGLCPLLYVLRLKLKLTVASCHGWWSML